MYVYKTFSVSLQFFFHSHLFHNQDKFINEGIASILLHSVNLFRNNLDGVFILIPSFIDAIELILGTKDFKTR